MVIPSFTELSLQVWEDFVEGQEDEVEEEQDIVDDVAVDRVTDYKEVIAL